MLTVRTATCGDAKALLEIYRPYVLDTAITFEYEVPTLEEFEQRIRHTLQKYPYLVAEEDGKIVGYAYASPFKSRAAYDWAVETSIYVEMQHRKGGVGRALYEALENALTKMNILNVNACISYPEKEDEHLTKNSVEFHEHWGYRMVGKFHRCGYKFGTWYHMVWMEKMLGEHTPDPKPVCPFSQLSQ